MYQKMSDRELQNMVPVVTRLSALILTLSMLAVLFVAKENQSLALGLALALNAAVYFVGYHSLMVEFEWRISHENK